MGLVAENKGGDFELAPEDTHIARCYRIVDLGTQHNAHFNKDSHKVLISWELPEALMEDGRPFSITNFYTVSLHEKATLRKHLEAWRGRAFTEDELNGFHLSKVLGAACYLGVVHKTSGDNVYANVSTITKLPKGIVCPEAVNPPFIFDLDSFDQLVFNDLSEKLQAMIMESPEYKGRGEELPPLADGLEGEQTPF